MQRDAFLGCRDFHSGARAENLFVRALSLVWGPHVTLLSGVRGLGRVASIGLRLCLGLGSQPAIYMAPHP